MIEFLGVWLKLLLNELFSIKTTLPIFPKGLPTMPHPHPPGFTKTAAWDKGVRQGWVSRHRLTLYHCLFQTHTAAEASNVKGPIYFRQPRKKRYK